MSIQKIEVSPDLIADEIGYMSPDELDELPFGVIRLDERARITAYNRYEESLSGRDRDDVIGKDFFRDVAPCTSVKEFRGAFESGVSRGKISEVFDFTFRFAGGDKKVRIRMISTNHEGRGVWIFVTPIEN